MLRHNMRLKDSLLFQKSRSKWLKEGDSNSSYFHIGINLRRRSNHINALWDGQMWVDQVGGIKDFLFLILKNSLLNSVKVDQGWTEFHSKVSQIFTKAGW
jgi:hypothetical protein